MLKKILSLSFIVLVGFTSCYFLWPERDSDTFKNEVIKNTVCLQCSNNRTRFSGVLIEGTGHLYILTCCHTIEDLLDFEELEDIVIVAALLDSNDELILKDCTVLMYSLPEELGGLDLALLEVNDYVKKVKGIKFSTKNPKLFSEVFHNGFISGEYPFGSLKGYVSHNCLNLTIEKNPAPFILISMEARGGCSGGGLYTKEKGDYYYNGMVLRADKHGLTLVRPSSVIVDWLKKNSYGYLVKE